jgi:hypothetical protein
VAWAIAGDRLQSTAGRRDGLPYAIDAQLTDAP